MKFKKKQKEKKSEDTVQEEKTEKLQVIKTDRIMKAGRIILWVVIFFLLLRGIGSILAPGSEIKMQQMITDYQAAADMREEVRIGAAAFAEDFARQYYTFSGNQNINYEQKVKRYLAKNMEIKRPVGNQYSSSVASAVSQNIIYHNMREYDVDVHLKVVYTPINGADGMETEEKNIYIRVPVSSDGKGKYAVTSFPVYIPETRAGNIAAVDTYKGVQVDTKKVQEIKETLNSFLSVYFGGTANELSYYLTADSSLKDTASGVVEYQKLDYATVSQDGESQAYLVDAKFTVSDNGQIIQQRVFFRMEYMKNHYYIESMNTRPI